MSLVAALVGLVWSAWYDDEEMLEGKKEVGEKEGSCVEEI